MPEQNNNFDLFGAIGGAFNYITSPFRAAAEGASNYVSAHTKDRVDALLTFHPLTAGPTLLFNALTGNMGGNQPGLHHSTPEEAAPAATPRTTAPALRIGAGPAGGPPR